MRALNKLLVAAGVHEGFTLRDLIKPEPARLRRNLSAIINFQKFREEKIEAWAGHGRRTVELEAAKAALEAERRDLESALTREKNLRAMEAPAIADLARTVAALAETKADLEATAGRLTASLAEQKATVAELIDGAATMDAKAKLVEDAHAALAATASDAASLQCRSEVVAKATKDVRKTLTLLAELETEVLRLKKVHKEAKAKATAKEEKAAELADAQAAAERLERRVRAAEEKLTEQKHSAYVKQEATQRANQALREELQNSQNELDRARGAQKEAATRIGAIKTDHDRIQAQHNAEMAEMVAAMKNIQRTVADYHTRLFATMADVGPGGSSALGDGM